MLYIDTVVVMEVIQSHEMDAEHSSIALCILTARNWRDDIFLEKEHNQHQVPSEPEPAIWHVVLLF